MRRRVMGTLALSLALSLVIVGCDAPGAAGPGGPAPSEGSTLSGGASPGRDRPPTTAVDLLNVWRVTGAVGESADTRLRLDARKFTLVRPCGTLGGSWDASDTGFLASLDHTASAGCVVDGAIPDADWLIRASSYDQVAGGWQLRDGSRVLATLIVDETATQRPVVSAGDLGAMREPPPLPERLRPVTPAFLVGDWVLPDGPAGNASGASFDVNGDFVGDDGCTRQGGRWGVGDGGRLLTTVGMVTANACAVAHVAWSIGDARRAASDGDTLVLLARDGAEIVRLVRR